MFLTTIDNYVILKSKRPNIFSPDGEMDKYLGDIFQIDTYDRWNNDVFYLKFVIPNQYPSETYYEISDLVFDADSCDPIKTRYLQLFLNTLSI